MKLMTPLYFTGIGHYLPKKRVKTETAIQNGWYREKDQKKAQYQSIAIEEHLYPADMAYLAIQQCIKNFDLTTDHLSALSYTSIHRHGNQHLWSPACHLADRLQRQNLFTFNLNQGCNGQLLAIQLAIHQLLADPNMETVLSVASDGFEHSQFNRWQDDYCIVYGDGAGAITIAKTPGFAKILSIQTVTDTALANVHGNEACFPETPDTMQKAHHIRESKKHFLRKYGNDMLTQKTAQALTTLYQQTFSEPHIQEEHLSYVILPNIGDQLLNDNYTDLFHQHNHLWENFGAHTGHLGASDCVIGLSHLMQQQQLKSGDLVLLVGAGAGFSWTLLLLEIC